ncbi:MAG: class I SAM-dependent methyltransferase [Oscillospiraceae bacterium]|nr:class I SAM-dependent methyltransferase [Oscillospiraceae bacterium]
MEFVLNGQFALYAEKVLSSKKYYKEYLNGEINSAQFRESMVADASLSGAAWFNEYSIKRISLMPPDEKLPAETIINYLTNNNIISKCENMYDGFDEYRKYIRENYNHGKFITFIYPEDERLLYAVTKITQPKKIFVAGSYYGYFAVWAMKTISENGGTAILSDINGEVCELAKENFEKLGYGNNAEIYCEDSETLLARRTESIDMLVLDATGKYDDLRPEYRGKRIYGALLKDAEHLLKKGSAIVIHNMEPENPEMKMLVEELQSINALGTSYDTYNGVGVYVIV